MWWLGKVSARTWRTGKQVSMRQYNHSRYKPGLLGSVLRQLWYGPNVWASLQGCLCGHVCFLRFPEVLRATKPHLQPAVISWGFALLLSDHLELVVVLSQLRQPRGHRNRNRRRLTQVAGNSANATSLSFLHNIPCVNVYTQAPVTEEEMQ